jgi:hypothetical protein
MPALSDDQTYADVVDCAAKLLAWKAARQRIANTDVDTFIRAAAECLILADTYRARAQTNRKEKT